MTGDDAHPLVELLRDRLGRAGFEKGDTVLAAGGEYLVARLLHLRGVGVARHLAITERKGEIARPQLGKADPGDAEDLLAACDPFRAFELDAEQQFAPLVERPGIAQLAVFGFETPQIGAALDSEPRPRVPSPSGFASPASAPLRCAPPP